MGYRYAFAIPRPSSATWTKWTRRRRPRNRRRMNVRSKSLRRGTGAVHWNRYPQREVISSGTSATLNQLSNRQIKLPVKTISRLLRYEAPFAKEIQQSGSGIRPYHYCKQVYSTDINLGDGVNVPDPYKFRLNSTFQCDETASSGQPLGRDLMATIYNDYFVKCARYNLVFHVRSSAPRCRGWVHVDTASTSEVTTFTEAMSRPDCHVFTLSSDSENKESETAIVQGFVQMKNHMSPSQGDFGEQFVAGVGNNPSVPVRLHIQVENDDGTALATEDIKCYVQIQYYVCYKTPIGTTES